MATWSCSSSRDVSEGESGDVGNGELYIHTPEN